MKVCLTAYLQLLRCILQSKRSVKSEVAAQGETFDFAAPVLIDGAVEAWMSAVEKEMRATLHRSVTVLQICCTGCTCPDSACASLTLLMLLCSHDPAELAGTEMTMLM